MCLFIRTYICIHTYIHTYKHACIYIYMHICMYYIFIYIYSIISMIIYFYLIYSSLIVYIYCNILHIMLQYIIILIIQFTITYYFFVKNRCLQWFFLPYKCFSATNYLSSIYSLVTVLVRLSIWCVLRDHLHIPITKTISYTCLALMIYSKSQKEPEKWYGHTAVWNKFKGNI